MENYGFLTRLFNSHVLIAGIIGAFICGGGTVGFDYYDYYHGPSSGHGGLGTMVVILLAVPSETFLLATHLNKTALYERVYDNIGGFAIAGITNGLLAFIICSLGVALLRRPQSQETNHDA